MAREILNPIHFVIPKKTKAERDTMSAEKGTFVYNTNDNTIYYSTTTVVGSTSWKKVTAV